VITFCFLSDDGSGLVRTKARHLIGSKARVTANGSALNKVQSTGGKDQRTGLGKNQAGRLTHGGVLNPGAVEMFIQLLQPTK